jgi:hypothetical protein
LSDVRPRRPVDIPFALGALHKRTASFPVWRRITRLIRLQKENDAAYQYADDYTAQRGDGHHLAPGFLIVVLVIRECDFLSKSVDLGGADFISTAGSLSRRFRVFTESGGSWIMRAALRYATILTTRYAAGVREAR